ncbi:MAG: hypothetical protein Q7R56_00930 [Nanoarchaeota archaeon]|nr:hypothetical protein [Nanoarchaeota archaeon]
MQRSPFYKEVLKTYHQQLHGSKELLPRMATLVAALKEEIPYYTGCGFYFAEQPELEIGPYQGKTLKAKISYHHICGKAIRQQQPIIERKKLSLALPLIDPEGRIIASFYATAQKVVFNQEDIQALQKILKKLFTQD